MAILGLNSDYIFFEGSWMSWSDADLDMNRMTTRQYNKERILRMLGLTIEKAPLFAALGDSLSNEANSRRLHQHFAGRNRQQMFQNITNFVNRQTFPITDATLTSVVNQIFGSCPSEVFLEIKEKLARMDPVENLKIQGKVDPNIIELVKDDFANYAEEILENSPIYISPVYLDLRNLSDANLPNLVKDFIQKASGILLKNLPDREDRYLFAKTSDYEKFTKIQIPPIIPDCKFNLECLEILIFHFNFSVDVPHIKVVVTGRMSENEKWDILLWISGLSSLSVKELKAIPDKFLVDVIVCLHLLQTGSIKQLEAECLMQSIVDTERGKMSSKYPSKINERGFRLSFLYSKIFCIFHSCIAAVGLEMFQVRSKCSVDKKL